MPTGAAIPSWLICTCFLLMLLSQPLWLSSASSGKPLHHEEECSALLGFKSTFFNESNCDVIGSPQMMMSWKVTEEGTAGDCCNWGGVTCDEGDGHVVGLDLSSSCLVGIMDSEASIFNLLHLQDLNLAYNWFNLSQVPSAIGRLPSLMRLNLSSSGFSGEVVPASMRFMNLSLLDLSGNVGMNVSSLELWFQSLNKVEELDLSLVLILDGKVPRSLGNMTSLRSLLLSDCGLSGEFPDSVLALPRLEFLDVSFNYGLRMTGLPHGSLMKSLKLSEMNLTGEVWISLRNLTHLTDVDLRNCELGGAIPSSIGDLTNLSMLDLGYNRLSGEIPSTLGNLIRLNQLGLGSNLLAGEILFFKRGTSPTNL